MVKLHSIGNIFFRIYGNDHRPAHFHVVAPDFKAMVEIETLELLPLASARGLCSTFLFS